MKNILFCILLTASVVLHSQTIDNPSFKARDNSIKNITRIERTTESTRVHIHAIFRPKWWINISSKYYLEDAGTGKQYKLKYAENIELDKQVYMPESGEKDFVLTFEPLPKETKNIHLISPDCGECNTYDISLVPLEKNALLLKSIRGNWYRTNSPGNWEYGIYDSITIMQNRIYANKSIQKRKKQIELTVQDKQNGEISTLLLTPRKDAMCLIQSVGNTEGLLYKKEVTLTPNITADKGFQNFFHTDSVCIQGYIDGYDRRLGFDAGIMYLYNELTCEDYPIAIPIEEDGTFRCKFSIEYPISTDIIINHTSYPFHIEPGETLTIYINWEDYLDLNRARNYNYPLKSTAYMGASAEMSRLQNILKKMFSTSISREEAQKRFTPEQYQEYMKPLIARAKQVCDSLVQLYAPSEKATRLIKNEFSLQMGENFLSFLMGREYYAKQDTTNMTLKAKETDAYYDFLKAMPLNDETILANRETRFFINRFEYMNPLSKAFSYIQYDSIFQFYPQKPLLSFFKEKGIKLNTGQDKVRQKHEKLAGVGKRVSLKELQEESELVYELCKREEKLIEEYKNLYSKQNAQAYLDEKYQEVIEDEKLLKELALLKSKDSIISSLCSVANPLAWQIAKVHSLRNLLKYTKTSSAARECTNQIKRQLTHPELVAVTERLLAEFHPKEEKKSYQLPEGKASNIFRNIIKGHAGKVLFIDFWATTCGPCRSGIEATAELRKKYKNHPEFQFIYISSKGESPQKAYEQYVEKHLKGEACYYISDTEFKYMRQLFHFNGIPHYVLVEKDGSISKENIGTHNIEKYLEKRFGN